MPCCKNTSPTAHASGRARRKTCKPPRSAASSARTPAPAPSSPRSLRSRDKHFCASRRLPSQSWMGHAVLTPRVRQATVGWRHASTDREAEDRKDERFCTVSVVPARGGDMSPPYKSDHLDFLRCKRPPLRLGAAAFGIHQYTVTWFSRQARRKSSGRSPSETTTSTSRRSQMV